MASLSVKCVDVAIIDFKLDPFASSGEHRQPTTMRTAIATTTSGSAAIVDVDDKARAPTTQCQ